ncbi:MAG: ATP-binding cassette domain-containing protein [Chloroflexota bacterium]
MIDVSDVSKAYGNVQALDGVSFHVEAGEIIGLLGPNGAGKTTMMKILTGYLQPDSGQVTVDGLDVLTDTLEVQKRIGYLPENAPLYPELSVQAYLKMIADLRHIPPSDQPTRLSEAIYATALMDHLSRPIGQLSKGYRQRVGLAQAIVHDPQLLILDEPTVGLDPTQIVEVRRLIRRLAQHSTVLLSTHILSEVEATCDRVIILLNGQVKADARLAELSSTTDVVLLLAQEMPGAGDTLKSLAGVQGVEGHPTPEGFQYRIQGGRGTDLRPAIYDLARQKDWPLCELRREIRTLETVFNELATAVHNSQDTTPGGEAV